MSSEGPVVLTYLDIKGYAEPIRLALTIGQVSFEDRRISYEEVKRLRSIGELPFGQVPVLDVNGERHSQSSAILRWAGKKAGLYPSKHQMRVDAILDAISDIQHSLVPAWYKHACGRSPVTGDFYATTKLNDEQIAGVFDALNAEILPIRFQQLERQLESHADEEKGPYFCGAIMTIADLSVYVLISGIENGTYLAGLSPQVVNKYRRLMKLAAAVASHPRVQEWEQMNSK